MKLVTYKEAAAFIGVPLSTMYALVSQRRIPVISFGARFKRFDLEALRKWVDEHREEPDAPSGSGRGGRQ